MPENLNNDQQQAVMAGDGPVLIIAGPGTGKTKTLAARIAYLVKEKDVAPESILALTFTKKAAEEMQERVRALLTRSDTGNSADAGSELHSPKVSTFHALCNEMLGVEIPFVTEAERLKIIKTLPRPKELKGLSARELALKISLAKNATEITDAPLTRLVGEYNHALHNSNVRDFDDLLQNTYQLLKTNKTAREAAQTRFSYILVDEFQDTNQLQYELLKLLRGNDNLFVIGDPNQSIYGFRGASSTIFDEFKKDFPHHIKVALTINYRSSPEVVRLSNAFFKDGPQLQAFQKMSGQVRAVEVLNEYGEASWVLGEIQKAIGGGDFTRAVSNDTRATHRQLSDFAVLYRNRSAANAFQKMIDESGLPYQVVGEGSPYERPEVHLIVALLRTAINGETLRANDLSTAQKRALGELLKEAAKAQPTKLVQNMVVILEYEPNRHLEHFLTAVSRHKTVRSLLEYIDEIAATGFYDPNADAITLLTIHASKGLEFPVVFLLAAEDGVLPSRRGELKEEKRLFYVAITRAKNQLEVMHARNRGGQPAKPSPFIDLPKAVLPRLVDPGIENQLRRITKRAAKRSQQSLF